jgi:hypothetical protein
MCFKLKSKCCNADVHKQNGSLFCTNCIRIIGSKDTKRFTFLSIFSLIFLIMFLCVEAKAPHSELSLSMDRVNNIIFPDIELNDSTVTNELIRNGCVLANVAVAQAHIESNFYTSKNTFENKNIFGIKVHKCKYVKGEKNNHAVFSSYRDCIACYCHIQAMYLNKIDGHYALNTNYINLIKQVK